MRILMRFLRYVFVTFIVRISFYLRPAAATTLEAEPEPEFEPDFGSESGAEAASEEVFATEADPEDPATPRNLLTHPAHGEPDDLTRIRGLPKVLEQTLHKVGVFYFWQIAEWSPEEVRYVDEQLEEDPGRISRDEWVSQANELAAEPSAAPRPLEH